MTLKLYSIKVGATTISDLNFETQFNLQQKNLSFTGILENDRICPEQKYPVYDVILAGVN